MFLALAVLLLLSCPLLHVESEVTLHSSGPTEYLVSVLSQVVLPRAEAATVPPLRGYVNDYGGMISPAVRAKIEGELKAFERSDSTQLVILTIPSLENDPIEDFSIKVAEAWKVGQKGKDNGIIFLVARNERKIRVEVGKGLEGRLTDLMAGRVIDMVVKPRFKRGDFDGGFIAGTQALIDATRGEFKGEKKKPGAARSRGGIGPLLALLVFGGIGILILGRLSKVLGGAAGAVGLPAAAYLALGPSIVTLVLLGIAGLLGGLFLPMLFSGRGHGGGDGPSTFFPGGFIGGGGFGSGGDSGGFDGGGGGDFGGGGASVDW